MLWRAISCRYRWNIRQLYNTTSVECYASVSSKIIYLFCDGRLAMVRLARVAL